MRNNIKQDILSCLQQEMDNSGLSVKDIALKIDCQDFRLIEDIVRKLFEEGTLIESGHTARHYKKYKIQKPGQDLLGR